MKLKDTNLKTLKPLRDLVAYKWLRVDKLTETGHIIIPDSIHEGAGLDRMGNKYTCEVLAIGPDCKTLTVGDRFLLHEYDKTDQGVEWDVAEVMFVEEKAVALMMDRNAEPIMVPAKVITDKMVEEYEEY